MSLPFGDDLGIPDDVDYEGILTNEENPLKQDEDWGDQWDINKMPPGLDDPI